jgi:hypothetical protein
MAYLGIQIIAWDGLEARDQFEGRIRVAGNDLSFLPAHVGLTDGVLLRAPATIFPDDTTFEARGLRGEPSNDGRRRSPRAYRKYWKHERPALLLPVP